MATDQDLWERICQGDAKAFDFFYRTQGPRLELFLRRLLGNQQAAEDVMQETFTQIWQRPNGFDPQRGTLRAYLFGAGRKRAAEWWRKQGVINATSPDNRFEFIEQTASLVGDTLGRLNEDQRTLLWLREVEGQTYAELAQVLDIPVGTVKSRLFAAREELRRVWNSAPPKAKEENV